MHVVTKEGAELHGRRFPPGTVLDLPEPEAKALLKAKTAVVRDAPAEDEAKS